MRQMTSSGSAAQSGIGGYETYETARAREIGQQRALLRNELHLLYRTCENIALWNCGVAGKFPRYVIVVGFRYDLDASARAQHRALQTLRYAYDGHSPKLWLSSYASSHAEVALHELHRGLPNELILAEPLLREMAAVRRELRRLDRMEQALVAYAPGGRAYRQLVRYAAQRGLTRYHLRLPRTRTPARFA
jgi:hypothetical protein